MVGCGQSPLLELTFASLELISAQLAFSLAELAFLILFFHYQCSPSLFPSSYDWDNTWTIVPSLSYLKFPSGGFICNPSFRNPQSHTQSVVWVVTGKQLLLYPVCPSGQTPPMAANAFCPTTLGDLFTVCLTGKFCLDALPRMC